MIPFAMRENIKTEKENRLQNTFKAVDAPYLSLLTIDVLVPYLLLPAVPSCAGEPGRRQNQIICEYRSNA